jgi:hypothetical protein
VLKVARMKSALAVLLVACTTPVTYGPPMTCSDPVSSECPGADCPTLDGELHDTANCAGPASSYVECDGWTIISTGDMVAWDIYFKDATFVAWITYDHTLPQCTLGPASFAPPACEQAQAMKLPACP